MPKLRNPLANEMLKRGVRTFLLRHFDSRARLPRMSGRIVCHVVDFHRDGTLAAQLDYLADREVKTFRIYTDRPVEVKDLLSSHQRFHKLHALVVPVTEERRTGRIWQLMDNYNLALSGDRWSLALRAGELLLYPHFATRTLPDLCQFLYDEGRRSLFAISLDLYPAQPSSASSFGFGNDGWLFDRYGYTFEFKSALQFDQWQGGFLQRYPKILKAFGRPHLSRTPLVRTGYRGLHTRDLRLGLPRILNIPNSVEHLSPTGCVASDHAYGFFQSRLTDSNRDQEIEKLLSAASVRMQWRHDDLIGSGFMNAGQWL